MPDAQSQPDRDRVQCQTTRRFLTAVDGLVECSWCERREIYRRLEPRDEAWLYVQTAISRCREEFAIPDDGQPTEIWLGDHPEKVYEAALGQHNLYLARDSDRWQQMYSGAHEAFHRVCSSQTNQSDWADEMFAVLYSLAFLDWLQETSHAAANRSHLVEQAMRCSLEQFLAIGSEPNPDGTYGRAYLVGMQLIGAVGWDRLRPLALMRRPDGTCDVETWLEFLGQRDAEVVAPIIGLAG